MLIAELPAKSFRPRRYRPDGVGAWSGHLSFVHDLIAAMRPRLLVELGTGKGESYFGMCQAVDENAISCACYAVGTWTEDSDAGTHNDSLFEEVTRYSAEHYAAFSTLLRSSGDAAVSAFGDGTIDLLHIDNRRTYDAVRKDFETWFPKVRPGGIVLIHDIAARRPDFEVWKLWEELAQSYAHFEFGHSHGLGVVGKPGNTATLPPFLEMLFFAPQSAQDTVRHYYAMQAELLERRHVENRAPIDRPQVRVQVFPREGDGYVESNSVTRDVTRGEWHEVVMDLPPGTPGPIRIDPLDRPGVVDFASIAILDTADGKVLARLSADAGAAQLSPIAQLIPLPAEGVLRFLSVGHDPQMLLPALDVRHAHTQLSVQMKMRVHDDLTGVLPFIHVGPPDDRTQAVARYHELRAEIRHLQAEHVAMAADYRRVNSENERLQGETAILRASLASSQERCERLGERTANQEAELRSLDKDLKRIRGELRAAYGSWSWRLTKPLRWARRATR